LVRSELAGALETIFERFARERGFTAEKPLEIQLSRGIKAGSHGHGEGRAADIAAVAGKGLLAWKQEWDRAMATAEKLSDPQQRVEDIAAEGPWKQMQIENPTAYQRERLADQQWVFQAHQDHIHVAK
jgi:hypothetical protein